MRLFFLRRDTLAGARRITDVRVRLSGREGAKTRADRSLTGRVGRGLAVAGLTLAAAGAAAAPAGAATVYFGALVDGRAPTSTELSTGAFAKYESQVGKKMAMIHWGQPWKMNGVMQPFQKTYFENVRAHGSIPVLNWCSWELGKGPEQPDFQLRDIYNGAYDAYITKWAQDAKAWGKPFMLRFNHEMNGWWYPWGEGVTTSGARVNGNAAGDSIKAWQHVVNIFDRVGATNVTWMWAPNMQSTSTRYASLSSLYPGDAYVDWTGLSAYNKDSHNWLSSNTLLTGSGTTYLRNTYQDLLNLAPRKPIALAETGSIEAGDGGAKKAAWLTDLLATQLPTSFPRIKALLYFDWAMAGYESVPVDSSATALSAFKSGIASATYATNVYGAVTASPIPALGDATTSTSATTAVPAEADTFVSAAAPTTSGGAGKELQADADPTSRSFLRFNLSGLAGKTLKSVKLRFKTSAVSYSGSSSSHAIRFVADTSWSETYMTYNNTVPVSSTTLGTINSGTASGTWYDITLSTSAVQQRVGGKLSLALLANGGDGLFLSSRETVDKPQLVVSY